LAFFGLKKIHRSFVSEITELFLRLERWLYSFLFSNIHIPFYPLFINLYLHVPLTMHDQRQKLNETSLDDELFLQQLLAVLCVLIFVMLRTTAY